MLDFDERATLWFSGPIDGDCGGHGFVGGRPVSTIGKTGGVEKIVACIPCNDDPHRVGPTGEGICDPPGKV